MVRVARATRLNNQVAIGPQSTADQMMMHRSSSQQTVQWHTGLTDTAIRKDNNIASLANGGFSAATHRFQCLPQVMLRRIIGHIDHDTAKALLCQRHNRLELGLGQHG